MTRELEWTPDLDLGDEHWLQFTSWVPDRELNPQFADLPDVERFGAVIAHRKENGIICQGGIVFDGEAARRTQPNQARWTVENWDPLTVSPSLLCGCGDHGFIRGGKWVRA